MIELLGRMPRRVWSTGRLARDYFNRQVRGEGRGARGEGLLQLDPSRRSPLFKACRSDGLTVKQQGLQLTTNPFSPLHAPRVSCATSAG